MTKWHRFHPYTLAANNINTSVWMLIVNPVLRLGVHISSAAVAEILVKSTVVCINMMYHYDVTTAVLNYHGAT